MPPIVSAGVLLTRLRGGRGEPEVLAIQRKSDRRRQGAAPEWEFPKGRLEDTDRSKLACAFRELAEEAGVALEPPAGCRQVGVERYGTSRGPKEVCWFHHHVADGEVRLGEREGQTQQVRFFSLGELRGLRLKGGSPRLAEQALQLAGSGGAAAGAPEPPPAPPLAPRAPKVAPPPPAPRAPAEAPPAQEAAPALPGFARLRRQPEEIVSSAEEAAPAPRGPAQPRGRPLAEGAAPPAEEAAHAPRGFPRLRRPPLAEDAAPAADEAASAPRGFARLGRQPPAEEAAAPAEEQLVVRVPPRYPGVQFRRSKDQDDRHELSAAPGERVSGRVEDDGLWLRVHRDGEALFLPMRVKGMSVLVPAGDAVQDVAGPSSLQAPGAQGELDAAPPAAKRPRTRPAASPSSSPQTAGPAPGDAPEDVAPSVSSTAPRPTGDAWWPEHACAEQAKMFEDLLREYLRDGNSSRFWQAVLMEEERAGLAPALHALLRPRDGAAARAGDDMLLALGALARGGAGRAGPRPPARALPRTCSLQRDWPPWDRWCECVLDGGLVSCQFD